MGNADAGARRSHDGWLGRGHGRAGEAVDRRRGAHWIAGDHLMNALGDGQVRGRVESIGGRAEHAIERLAVGARERLAERFVVVPKRGVAWDGITVVTGVLEQSEPVDDARGRDSLDRPVPGVSLFATKGATSRRGAIRRCSPSAASARSIR